MKWINHLARMAGSIGVAAGAGAMMATQADAAPAGTLAAGGTDGFVMLDGSGGQANGLGNDTTIVGSIGGGNWAVSSTKKFSSFNWTAHDGTTFGPGTYTIDTIEGGIYSFTVGAGQVGGHILFNWNTAANIDVINVWDVTGNTYTSRDWDMDGNNVNPYGVVYPGETNVRGGAMIDGAFPGFNANFNFEVTPVPEPMSMALVGSSLIGLVALRRRMQK